MFQAYPPVLYLQGLLTEMDGEMLAAYCYAVGMIHRCQRRIKRDGLQLRRPIGQVYIHPLSRHRPPGSAGWLYGWPPSLA